MGLSSQITTVLKRYQKERMKYKNKYCYNAAESFQLLSNDTVPNMNEENSVKTSMRKKLSVGNNIMKTNTKTYIIWNIRMNKTSLISA